MTANVRSAFSKWSPAQKILAGLTFTLAGTFGAQAHVPEATSEQGKMLAPFSEAIMHMTKPSGGSCCSLNDGRGNLEERITKDGKYQVKLTHDLAGSKLPPERTRWVDIPEDAILSAKHMNAVCKPRREADAASTCKTPPFNVIWFRDDGHVYCYFPKPQIM